MPISGAGLSQVAELIDSINRFIQSLERERRLSANTIHSYHRDLLRLEDFAQGRHIGSWCKLTSNLSHLRSGAVECSCFSLSAQPPLILKFDFTLA